MDPRFRGDDGNSTFGPAAPLPRCPAAPRDPPALLGI